MPTCRILRKPREKLSNKYQKEQSEYIQDQFNKIKNSAEDRQSQIIYQTVDEVIGRPH